MGEADVVRDGGWWGVRATEDCCGMVIDGHLIATAVACISRVYPIDSARLPGPVLSRVRRG